MKTKDQVHKHILEIGIIPVVRAISTKHAIAAAEAVAAGGISIVEVTMTVPGALDAIKELVRNFGNKLVVGAGTVLQRAAGDEEVGRLMDHGSGSSITIPSREPPVCGAPGNGPQRRFSESIARVPLTTVSARSQHSLRGRLKRGVEVLRC